MSMIGRFLAVPQSELDALRAAPGKITELLFDTRYDDALRVEKAWHGIHYLLTGTVAAGKWPLANVIFGRTPIGEEDLGYGPALGTDAADVPAISAALEAITDTELRARFDPDSMDEIYPNIWDEGDEALDYLIEHLQNLRGFYRDAAANAHAVITWLG
ncbi:DUF1877 family protein [Massilia dura]|uniref:DUF1877 family protein n=1 Tax=Pseudoduganella dura TaxID=321982 RepID=A0A6I3XX66_9BURK|nr:YfbM family protein [Pseudoduganella dura]MUI16355.1 DUF1877 family protein [Pseudoduganella dura]GGX86194.1 hypothetical protein GCM10007386_16230 [Pseudoduganella dura]